MSITTNHSNCSATGAIRARICGLCDDTLAETKPDAVVIWGMWNLSPLVAAEAERCAGSNVAYYFANEWPIEPSCS